MDIINSHDKYFKKIFSRKEDAIDLLKGGLSAKQIADILELDLKFVEKTIKEGLEYIF